MTQPFLSGQSSLFLNKGHLTQQLLIYSSVEVYIWARDMLREVKALSVQV